MVFSSITFLYYFLPVLLIIYFLVPTKGKNIVLLMFSLLFYFYGEPSYVLLLLSSILFNYFIAKKIDSNDIKISKRYMIFGVAVNILILMYFKYTNFFITNINQVLNTNISFIYVVMPIGISFFTFQEISYLIDVYRKDVKPCDSLISYATYVSLFPQLVAGPIVRYKTVNEELKSRTHSIEIFGIGAKRFVIGLSKKVILANLLGDMAVNMSNIPDSTFAFWIKAIAYTMQLYLDFSAYSDMAIGLGKMFGFNFNENFNYPLIANSITDFWRRWHISLSSFFKDYVYIPLGGNRVSSIKWIRNIFVVWGLTGFWHGASWNFILWGLYFAVLLVLEKKYLSNFLQKHKIFSHIYTLFLVIISFVIFNNESMSDIFKYIKGMFGVGTDVLFNGETLYYFRSYFVILVLSVISSTPLLKNVVRLLNQNKYTKKALIIVEPICIILLLVISTSFLINESYNPFLYFRF